MSIRIPPSMDEVDSDLPPLALSWHVIWSKRGSEQAAADALYAEGFDVYLPKETVQSARRPLPGKEPLKVERPLFPRYLFAACEVPDQWVGMCRVEGVERVMGKLSPKASMRLYRLKAEQARGDFDQTIDRSPQLKIKQLVKIDIEGREVFGEILNMTADQRVEVLLINFLGKATAIRDKAEVRAA